MKKLIKRCILGAVAILMAVTGPVGATCENGSERLGEAGECAVFQTADSKVTMAHGDPTGVDGDVCMGPGSELSMSGGQIITGTAFLDFQVDKIPNDLEERAGAIVETDLMPSVLAAEAAAADLASLACDVVFDKLKIDESETLSVADFNPGGTAVVCVDGDMEVKDSGTMLSLTGNAGESFVFKVGGAFKVNGATIAASGDLTASDIVFFLDGPGKDVAFSGGGGGIGCCNSEIDGSIVGLDRKIRLSPGKVNGQVVSGKDITLSSGSLVVCAPGDGGGDDGGGDDEGGDGGGDPDDE